MIRGRRANLLLAPGRRKRLMLRTDLKARVVAIRAKAKVNHPGVGDTLELLASQGRERFSIATSLDTLEGIALRGRDPRVMEHHNPNHQWDMCGRSFFLLTLTWAPGTSISPTVLHKHLLLRKRATWARAWVWVEARTFRPVLRRPRSVSTSWYYRLSLQISLMHRVRFYSRTS